VLGVVVCGVVCVWFVRGVSGACVLFVLCVMCGVSFFSVVYVWCVCV